MLIECLTLVRLNVDLVSKWRILEWALDPPLPRSTYSELPHCSDRTCYRPQRNCGKVIFSHVSVSHSVHGGGSLPQCMLGYIPPSPGQTPPREAKSPDGHCSGRYASYWNAFLLSINSRWQLCNTHCLLAYFSGGSRIFQMGGRCFVTNGGAHILFSGKKCMKLKEIGLKWGGARLLAPCYSKITIFLWIILNSIMKTSYFTYFENNLLKRPPGSLGAMVLLQNCSFDT